MRRRYQRLLDQDSNPILVFEPPANRVAQIYLYHQELLELSRPHYLENDSYFYPRLKYYYDQIANLFDPVIDCDRLLPKSRHDFFICGDPEPHPQFPDKRVLGLSGLQRLIGCEYEIVTDSPVVVRRADRLENTLVALHAQLEMAFPGQGHHYLTFPVSYLNELIGEINFYSEGQGNQSTVDTSEIESRIEKNLDKIEAFMKIRRET